MAATPGYREATPAFQEYAADMLSSRHFRMMRLAERGLFYTLRLECWVNGSVPSDPTSLARMLASDPDEIKRLIPAVKVFMETTEGGELRFPDLDKYRHEQMVRREKLKGGATATNSKRYGRKPSKLSKPVQESPGESLGDSLGESLGDSPLSGDERSVAEKNGEASSEKGDIQQDGWVEEYNKFDKHQSLVATHRTKFPP